MIIVRRTTSALVALACLTWAAPANAQLSKVGAAVVVPGGATAYSRTTDTAYDTTHSVLTIYGTEGTLQLPDPNTFGGTVSILRPV